MRRFDQYILVQLLRTFAIFALIFAGLFWVNRSVSLFDRLVGDGQGIFVFVELTALILPRLVLNILPIATFAAAVFVTHRLISESELTVSMAAGVGPWRLARPFAMFGAIVALMIAALAHVLVPAAQYQLTQRKAEISGDVVARILQEGRFVTPMEGVTFYAERIDQDDVLHGILLADRRDAQRYVTYTATKAHLVHQDDATLLIMLDGLVQWLDPISGNLSTSRFADFSLRVDAILPRTDTPRLHIQFLASRALWRQGAASGTIPGTTQGDIAEERHGRMDKPIFGFVTALIGFSVLMLRVQSRFGAWREIGLAFFVLVAIDGLRSLAAAAVLQNAQSWPLMYLPSAFGLCLALGLLFYASLPSLPGRFRTT